MENVCKIEFMSNTIFYIVFICNFFSILLTDIDDGQAQVQPAEHTHTRRETERERKRIINTYIIAMLQRFLYMAFDEPFLFLSLYFSLLFIRLTFLSCLFMHSFSFSSPIRVTFIVATHFTQFGLLFSRLPLNNWVIYHCVYVV